VKSRNNAHSLSERVEISKSLERRLELLNQAKERSTIQRFGKTSHSGFIRVEISTLSLSSREIFAQTFYGIQHRRRNAESTDIFKCFPCCQNTRLCVMEIGGIPENAGQHLPRPLQVITYNHLRLISLEILFDAYLQFPS